jgi:RNA polymerase sigma-70 factor (ECF subfamily)
VAAVDPLSNFVHNARLGDRRALDAFVEGTYDAVWRLCAALVDAQGADDLTQETYVRVVRALPNFRGESSARTWALSIARHVCLDELRGRARRRRRDDALGRGKGPVAPDASGAVTVNDLIAHLDQDRRAAFVLTQVIGLSYDESARVCGCPAGTIRSRVARARVELAELFRSSAEEADLEGSTAS